MEVKTTIAVEIRASDRDHEKEEIPKLIAQAVVEVTKGRSKLAFFSFFRFILFYIFP